MRPVCLCAVIAATVACEDTEQPGGDPVGASPIPPPAISQNQRPVALAVVTAVDYEFAAVRSSLLTPQDSRLGGRKVVEGTVAGKHVVVIQAGWGKAHAGGATALILERYQPERVLMAGVAGGLIPTAATSGDVVIVDGTLQHDLGKAATGGFQPWQPVSPTGQPYGELFRADKAMLSSLWLSVAALELKPWTLSCECPEGAPPTCNEAPRLVGRRRPRSCVGVAASGDVFVSDTAGAEAIALRAHSVVVDMETAAVAQECANHSVPFAAVRVVADVVAPQGESLYECLKPFCRQRLIEVMAAVLPALVTTPPASTRPEPSACSPDVTATAVEAALMFEQQKRAKVVLPNVLQIR
ncbi:MAG: 5'-methylthioadenosine/S-adenosylhomocysteine nucleosidase [Planctomycetota bacterium]